jgi:hypothetical protein
MASAENIQTVQGFVGYFDPGQAERMAQGCGFRARGASENKGDRAGERRTKMAIAANIQTMQGFLGYFDPGQAERMARGCRPEPGADWLSQALAALQDIFQDWEISVEEARTEGDKVAVRFAVPNHQLQGSRAPEPDMHA